MNWVFKIKFGWVWGGVVFFFPSLTYSMTAGYWQGFEDVLGKGTFCLGWG